MLLPQIDPKELASQLLPHDQWQPFPKIEQRDAWTQIARQSPAHHAYCATLLSLARQHASEPWPQMPATLYARYARDGNRTAFENPYFERRRRVALYALALGLEDTDTWRDRLIDAIWSICEESSWCVPAHAGLSLDSQLPDVHQPVVDLFAAETGMVMAEILWLAASRIASIAPKLASRVRNEIIQRIIVPVETRDFWWYTGRNNWTPWCCVNVLTAACYTLNDRQRLANLILRLSQFIDNYIALAPQDGGSDEGPTYWNVGHLNLAMFLELLHQRTQGRVSIFNQPLIKSMGDYILKAHIHDDYYANFADSQSHFTPRMSLARRFAQRTGNDALQRFAIHHLQRKFTPSLNQCGMHVNTWLRDLFWHTPATTAASEDSPTYHWLQSLQVINARSHADTAQGLTLIAKGGHNGENHNHNDVGHFMIYHQGRPVIIDAGVGDYTRDTFNPATRYHIWAIRASGHNAPIINGCEQPPGEAFHASNVTSTNTPDQASLQMDLATAYPPDAGVASLQRRLTLDRTPSPRVVVQDTYTLQPSTAAADTSASSTSAAAGEISLQLNLLTPCGVQVRQPGQVELHHPAQSLLMTFDPAFFQFETQSISFGENENRLRISWGDSLTRMMLTHRSTKTTGRYELTFTPLA